MRIIIRKNSFTFFKCITLFVMALTFLNLKAQTTFKHPGIYSSKEQLDFIKEKIQLGEEPWKSAYDKLVAVNPTTREPKAYVRVPGSSEPGDRADMDEFVYDGSYAYTSALLFYFTGEQKYADHAIKILNAWNIFQHPGMALYCTWAAPHFMNAAELMKHTPGSGWKEEDIQKFKAMADKYMWKHSAMPATQFGSNAGCTAVEAKLAIAIFLDDKAKYDEAIADLNWLIPKFILLNVNKRYNGETPETCRDLNHVKLIAGMMYATEYAWNQGLDLWERYLSRWSAFAELHAGIMTGDTPVPSDMCAWKSANQAGILYCRGGVPWNDVTKEDQPPCNEATWEIMYNHVERRLGTPLPITKKMLERNRPLGAVSRRANKWETLLHANINPADFGSALPINPSIILTSPAPNRSYKPGIKVFLRVEASDLDGSIISVRFRVNGEMVEDVKQAPYSASWTPSEPGFYTIDAVAFDNDSLRSVSDSVVVEISNDALPTLVVESVDGEQDPNLAVNLFDGLKDDDHRWSVSGFPKSVVLDYGEPKSIIGTKVWNYQGRSYHYTIELSNSPVDGFVEVVNQSGSVNSQPVTHMFDAVSARYLRLTVTGATGYASNWVSINEIEIIESNGTPINELVSGQASISIYPNPANSKLYIDMTNRGFKRAQLQVLDVSGHIVLDQKLNNSVSQIDVSELKRGFYLLRIINGDDIINSMFIKQ